MNLPFSTTASSSRSTANKSTPAPPIQPPEKSQHHVIDLTKLTAPRSATPTPKSPETNNIGGCVGGAGVDFVGNSNNPERTYIGVYQREVTKAHPVWDKPYYTTIYSLAYEKEIPLGNFATQIEAAVVYDKAAVKIHGCEANTNFPLNDYNLPFKSNDARDPARAKKRKRSVKHSTSKTSNTTNTTNTTNTNNTNNTSNTTMSTSIFPTSISSITSISSSPRPSSSKAHNTSSASFTAPPSSTSSSKITLPPSIILLPKDIGTIFAILNGTIKYVYEKKETYMVMCGDWHQPITPEIPHPLTETFQFTTREEKTKQPLALTSVCAFWTGWFKYLGEQRLDIFSVKQRKNTFNTTDPTSKKDGNRIEFEGNGKSSLTSRRYCVKGQAEWVDSSRQIVRFQFVRYYPTNKMQATATFARRLSQAEQLQNDVRKQQERDYFKLQSFNIPGKKNQAFALAALGANLGKRVRKQDTSFLDFVKKSNDPQQSQLVESSKKLKKKQKKLKKQVKKRKPNSIVEGAANKERQNKKSKPNTNDVASLSSLSVATFSSQFQQFQHHSLLQNKSASSISKNEDRQVSSPPRSLASPMSPMSPMSSMSPISSISPISPMSTMSMMSDHSSDDDETETFDPQEQAKRNNVAFTQVLAHMASMPKVVGFNFRLISLSESATALKCMDEHNIAALCQGDTDCRQLAVGIFKNDQVVGVIALTSDCGIYRYGDAAKEREFRRLVMVDALGVAKQFRNRGLGSLLLHVALLFYNKLWADDVFDCFTTSALTGTAQIFWQSQFPLIERNDPQKQMLMNMSKYSSTRGEQRHSIESPFPTHYSTQMSKNIPLYFKLAVPLSFYQIGIANFIERQQRISEKSIQVQEQPSVVVSAPMSLRKTGPKSFHAKKHDNESSPIYEYQSNDFRIVFNDQNDDTLKQNLLNLKEYLIKFLTPKARNAILLQMKNDGVQWTLHDIGRIYSDADCLLKANEALSEWPIYRIKFNVILKHVQSLIKRSQIVETISKHRTQIDV